MAAVDSPCYTAADIVKWCHQANITHITDSSLHNPNLAFVAPLYESLFTVAFAGSFDSERLRQTPFDAQLSADYNPESSVNCMPRLLLCKFATYAFQRLGMSMEFTLRDLLYPQSKRTCIFVSCLIRYISFCRKGPNADIVNLLSDIDARATHIEQASATIVDLKAALDKELKAKDAEGTECERLTKELDAERAEVKEIIDKMTTTSETLATLGEQWNRLKPQYDEVRKECDALQREHNIAENDVVTDPKRLRDAVAHIQEMQKELENGSNDLVRLTREAREHYEDMHARHARVFKLVTDLSEVEGEQLEAKKAQGVVAELEDKIAAHKRKEDDSRKALDRAKSGLADLTEKKKEKEIKHRQQMAEYKAKTAAIRESIASYKSECEKESVNMSETVLKIEEITKKIESMTEHMESIHVAYGEKHEELQNLMLTMAENHGNWIIEMGRAVEMNGEGNE